MSTMSSGTLEPKFASFSGFSMNKSVMSLVNRTHWPFFFYGITFGKHGQFVLALALTCNNFCHSLCQNLAQYIDKCVLGPKHLMAHTSE